MKYPISTSRFIIVILWWFGLVSSMSACAGRTYPVETLAMPTPLAASGFKELTTATDRSSYLQRLAGTQSDYFTVNLQTIATTVENRPVAALLLTPRNIEKNQKSDGLRIMLLAAQHGNEISGCEALLSLAGYLITGLKSGDPLGSITYLMIPAVNPDGIENKRRVNADGINLSTDYGSLKAPESTGVNRALLDFRPHVVLDIHESAILKKKSLGAEGWLTDFEAQFEFANNPNVHPALRRFTSETMLPELIEKVSDSGLPVNRYIGEITSAAQVVRHGGLSARNFRNKAGLAGAVSFLLENRLDPSTGNYPTPRNIRSRVEKQRCCINAFLSVCLEHASRIVSVCEAARNASAQSAVVYLQPEYGVLESITTIDIPLRRRDTGERVMHRFQYHGRILPGPAFRPPMYYRFRENAAFFKIWLEKQEIPFRECSRSGQFPCIEARIDGPNGLLLPLYLQPASGSFINFQYH